MMVDIKFTKFNSAFLLMLNAISSLINCYPLPFDYNAPPDIYKKIMSIENSLSRGYAVNLPERLKWTNGIVPYVIDSAFNQIHISIIRSGMKLIEDSTRIDGKDCIKFVQRRIERNYLRIINEDGCWSYLGKVFPGVQDLSLKIPTQASPGSCLFVGTVAHEFIHALGFDHEHVRPDRDNFVRINWDNIKNEALSNFEIRSNGNDLGFSYDYDSIMHYASNSFSLDGFSETITPLQSGIQLINKFNQTYLTQTDIGEIRKFYECKGNAHNLKYSNFVLFAMFFFSFFRNI